ncbi:MAG: hypothetical protein DRO01_02785 [Thermoproteota archaeon]|nr:MAG: hypothetical protein DRO01_02785 [Candidatus Korarchaeota archaeon]
MQVPSVRAVAPVPRLVSAALSLSRAREYVLQLTLVFPAIEVVAPGLLLSLRALLVYAANLLYTAFAYSFNDVEDAEDDALDPVKGSRNPVSAGLISRRTGYAISLAFLAAGLALMAALSIESLVSGSLFSANAAAYSWHRIRLKAVPILDLLSHAAALGVPQLTVAYLAFRPPDSTLLAMAVMVALFSMASQLSQQIRDFEVDRLAGVRNTTQLLGIRRAKVLMLALLAAASASYVWLVGTLPIPSACSLAAPLGVIGPLAYFKAAGRI